MPLYEYECPKCGRFELIRKFSDDPVTECPTCASPVQKLASAPAFHLKGSGWYVTDYARKDGKSGTGASGEVKAGDTKGGEGKDKSKGGEAAAASSPDASPAPKKASDSGSASSKAAKAASTGGGKPSK